MGPGWRAIRGADNPEKLLTAYGGEGYFCGVIVLDRISLYFVGYYTAASKPPHLLVEIPRSFIVIFSFLS